MSYHNLHLLRYRRAPESNISKENNESGSDNNHMINHYNNPNKQHMLPSSSSTTILTNIQNRNQRQQQHKRLRTKEKTRDHPKSTFFTNCCRTNPTQQQEKITKR
jgi:hypothetical protein